VNKKDECFVFGMIWNDDLDVVIRSCAQKDMIKVLYLSTDTSLFGCRDFMDVGFESFAGTAMRYINVHPRPWQIAGGTLFLQWTALAPPVLVRGE
jgi:hypothetical protein